MSKLKLASRVFSLFKPTTTSSTKIIETISTSIQVNNNKLNSLLNYSTQSDKLKERDFSSRKTDKDIKVEYLLKQPKKIQNSTENSHKVLWEALSVQGEDAIIFIKQNLGGVSPDVVNDCFVSLFKDIKVNADATYLDVNRIHNIVLSFHHVLYEENIVGCIKDSLRSLCRATKKVCEEHTTKNKLAVHYGDNSYKIIFKHCADKLDADNFNELKDFAERNGLIHLGKIFESKAKEKEIMINTDRPYFSGPF